MWTAVDLETAGKADSRGQNWGHVSELYGACRVLGFSTGRGPAGTWKLSVPG